MPVESSVYGKTKDGQIVTSYHLYNERMEIECIDYGAALIHVWYRDKSWRFRDIVLGYDDIEGYENDRDSLGATVGRNCNRIAGGLLTIDGAEYKLATNDGGINNLHSGPDCFKTRIWDAWTDVEDKNASVTFVLKSPDMDQGFPGNAVIYVTYTLGEDNSVRIDYKAKSDKKTIFNMTNHTYFNLNGELQADAMNHRVWMAASNYTPNTEASVPTGNIESVEGTPFDFRQERELAEGLKMEHPQLTLARGYDHNLIFDQPSLDDPCAYFYSPLTGIECTVFTTAPCVQIYTANYLENVTGRGGSVYNMRNAVCFETQGYVDAEHHENFPSNLYEAGEVYRSSTIYAFGLHEEPASDNEE